MTIREHPLAWRWTVPKHAVLPDSVLDQMQPFSQQEAEKLFKHACSFNGQDGLSTDLFEVRVISTASLSLEAGRAWLRALQPVLTSKILLSWQPDTAITTTWDVFTEYWSDFCCPASDDLNVWPEDEQWALLFHHEEEFHFGFRKHT
jgi:hypothetical protein